MGGLHIISDLFGCKNKVFMCDKDAMETRIVELVNRTGLTIVGTYFHQFGGGNGVTGVVVLAESHISVHTWPEKDGFVNMDVFVCNVVNDNTKKAKAINEGIKKMFAPKKSETQNVIRS
ncbi:adenosylmethionine decarboxylase [Candidatus Micrarchaeota archaeon]|nr:adenosylmethionine decarboxylase [Candidatus Micrarchaeota archaeon]